MNDNEELIDIIKTIEWQEDYDLEDLNWMQNKVFTTLLDVLNDAQKKIDMEDVKKNPHLYEQDKNGKWVQII